VADQPSKEALEASKALYDVVCPHFATAVPTRGSECYACRALALDEFAAKREALLSKVIADLIHDHMCRLGELADSIRRD
jgi:hypothetical protein